MATLEVKDFLKQYKMKKFIFMNHTKALGGRLDNDLRAHACWYYARCATKMMYQVDEGATYEGELDHVENLYNLAIAIALQYELDDPDAFLQFMYQVKEEVEREGGTWDTRIENPYVKGQRKDMN